MASKKKSIVVVLGMHRSGTSAITRSLQVLGVELGERLMAPVSDTNEKGFFEDVDVNAINIELLQEIGQDWHTLTLPRADELHDARCAHLQLRAIELLRTRLLEVDCFGFKDPRVCRLLPFWQRVFERLQVDASYVLAIRNPICVAMSLDKRYRLPPEKSHYLWLQHVLPSVVLTRGFPRVVVDYDLLLADPKKQVSRIARSLGLEEGLNTVRLAEFCRDFLDSRLRHANFKIDDVYLDPLVPNPVRSAVKILVAVAADKRSLESKGVVKAFEDLSAEMQGMSPTMSYLHRLDDIIADLSRTLSQRNDRIGVLTRELDERDGRIEALTQNLGQREARVAALTRELDERDGRIEALTQNLGQQEARVAALTRELDERDGRIEALTQNRGQQEARVAALTRELDERDGRIDALTQNRGQNEARVAALTRELDERDGRIDALTQNLGKREVRVALLAKNLSEHDGRIESLNHTIKEKDALIQHVSISAVQVNHRLHQSRASLGWRLFEPARMINRLLMHLGQMITIDLILFNQLHAEGAKWVAIGNDPQFLLIADRAWEGIAGWWWLKVNQVSDQPLNAQLFFDLGQGFDPSRVINFEFTGKGSQKIPIFVPPGCHAIRLDPCDEAAMFELSVQSLRRLNETSEIPPQFLAHSVDYEAIGAMAGNVWFLNPLSDLQYYRKADYTWCAVGADSSFALKGMRKTLRPGWYFIELSIRSDIDRGNAKLYLDFGAGFSEKTAVLLPYKTNQVVKRLILLSAVPKHIRFDPLEEPAAFSVRRFHVRSVTPIVAHNHMLERLGDHYSHYKDDPVAQIWQHCQARAETKNIPAKDLLYQDYNQTFPANSPHDTDGYANWIAKIEAPEIPDLAMIDMVRKSFECKPTVSVIMPVYNTAETFLRQAIESVLVQSYPDWELCIADDASPTPLVREVLEEYSRRDSRIKVTFRSKNGHISLASNSALTLATGEYIGLMDHDDELAPHALHFVVEAINQNPSADVFYSDEDKIDEKGNRSDPHLKPDWNPDLFFSQNYVSHFGVYRRDALKRIGGFRTGVEGSQDQDLLLRCLPHLKPTGIVHIPKVLYHWRVLQGSTAHTFEEKEYTTEAGIKALRDFFSVQGREDVTVETGLAPNTYRVRYPIPKPEPLVSLLIPTRDGAALLKRCIRSILDKTTYQNYEILILDNESVEASTRDYFDRIQAEETRIRVLPYYRPFNFSAINNYGVQQAAGELIGLVNNDTEVITPEWLTEMVSHALRPEIGCVGAKLYYADDTVQHAGVILGIGGVAGHSHKHFPREAHGYFSRLRIIQNLSAVTAACLVVRKATYEQVGGLEEAGLGIAFNDVDFCLKLRQAGYRNIWTPYAELYHHESKSRGPEDSPEKVERFNKEIEFMTAKWGNLLSCDPYYSPHLTLTKEDFSFR